MIQHEYAEIGYFSAIGRPSEMPRHHAHDELEVNYVFSGGMSYSIGGRLVEVPPGRLAVFWAAHPHGLVGTRPDTVCGWVTVPLATLISWRLPAGWIDRVLAGEVIQGMPDPVAGEVFRRWPGEEPAIVLLEVEAALRRLAKLPNAAPDAGSEPSAIEAMCRFMATQFGRSIQLVDIAAAANMHPNHAGRIFRRAMGMTPTAYLRRHRLAHAKRLLATTTISVSEVAAESGFAGESQFFALFRREVGHSPRQFRAQSTS